MREFQAQFVPEPRDKSRFSVVNYAHLDIEIGCGTGLFAINYARNHPMRTLVAIERTQIRFNKFSHALQSQHQLKNVIAVYSDAVPWITHNIPKESIENYFLLYPNPYPKGKHGNRRWYAMPFTDHLLHTLKRHGTITLATNLRHYFESAEQQFTSQWGLRLKSKSQYSNVAAKEGRSLFEKKYLLRDQTCYNLVFEKL